MKYKVWGVTYITEIENDGIKTSIKERTKKLNYAAKYLFEADDLEALRAKLMLEKGCNKINFNYDS